MVLLLRCEKKNLRDYRACCRASSALQQPRAPWSETCSALDTTAHAAEQARLYAKLESRRAELDPLASLRT